MHDRGTSKKAKVHLVTNQSRLHFPLPMRRLRNGVLIAVAAIACSSVSAQEHDEQSERISSLNGKRRWIDPFFDISDFSEERKIELFAVANEIQLLGDAVQWPSKSELTEDMKHYPDDLDFEDIIDEDLPSPSTRSLLRGQTSEEVNVIHLRDLSKMRAPRPRRSGRGKGGAMSRQSRGVPKGGMGKGKGGKGAMSPQSKSPPKGEKSKGSGKDKDKKGMGMGMGMDMGMGMVKPPMPATSPVDSTTSPSAVSPFSPASPPIIGPIMPPVQIKTQRPSMAVVTKKPNKAPGTDKPSKTPSDKPPEKTKAPVTDDGYRPSSQPSTFSVPPLSQAPVASGNNLSSEPSTGPSLEGKPSVSPSPTYTPGTYELCYPADSDIVACPNPQLAALCDKYSPIALFSKCYTECITAFCCIHDSKARRSPSCSNEINCKFYKPCYIIWWKLHDTIGPAPYLRLDQNETFYDVNDDDFQKKIQDNPTFYNQFLGHHFLTDDLPLTEATFTNPANW